MSASHNGPCPFPGEPSVTGTSSLVSEPSELSRLSELIELPELFSSMKKCLFCGALRLGDPLIKLLELRFVSLSSESSITSHPVFPDVDDGRCGNWCCRTTGGQGCPGTLPGPSW